MVLNGYGNADVKWVSVSTFARMRGVSVTTVYNMRDAGLIECMDFKRGSMRGFLVKVTENGKSLGDGTDEA